MKLMILAIFGCLASGYITVTANAQTPIAFWEFNGNANEAVGDV